MASLRNLVFALVVVGAAANAHGAAHGEVAHGEAAHGEAAHGEAAPAPVPEAAHEAEHEAHVPAADMTKEELEAEVTKLKAELKESVDKNTESTEGSALVLLFSVAFVMIIFYLVNSKSDVVRDQTWHITSTSISIFAAVMLNVAVKSFWGNVLPKDGENGSVSMEFGYLIGWWLSAVVLLYIDRESSLRLVGYGTIYGHILGFAAIGAYGTLASTETFHESHWMTLVVIIIYIFSVPLIVAPTACLGRVLKSEELHEQCKETSIDFYAMGLSFLIAMFFRGWIKIGRVGHAAGVHAVGKGSTAEEVAILFAVGLLFVILACIFTVIHSKTKPAKGSKSSGAVSELFHILATIMAMTCAWCWLEAATWVGLSKVAPNAGGHGDGGEGHHRMLGGAGMLKSELSLIHMPQGEFMAKLSVAAFFTLVFVFAVFLFSFLIHTGGKETKRIIKGLMTAVSLVVGLSWEHLFDKAIEDVSEMAHSEEAKGWLKTLLALVLVLIVTPAWMVYILPKHNDELIEKYGNKQMSAFACCGDCCEDDEEDGEYDEADDEDYE